MKDINKEIATFDSFFRKTIVHIQQKEYTKAHRNIKFAIGALSRLMLLINTKESSDSICKV